MHQNEKGTRINGWIVKSTRIGPVLNIKGCHHDDRYSIEVLVQSLFQDRTASWVRIVNGVDKCVTESMLTKKEKDIAAVKPIAKARPRQKPTLTLTSVSTLVRERKLIDIETQRSHDHKCFDVSKAIIRLLRHDQTVHREIDGAIEYNDIIEQCRKKKFDDVSQWLLEDWISTLAMGGGAKKKLKYCVNPNSSTQFLYLRAIQRHSGDNAVDPESMYYCRKDLPSKYIFHVGNASALISIIINGLTSRVLHNSETNGGGIWYGGNSTRSDETKNRSIQEYLETP